MKAKVVNKYLNLLNNVTIKKTPEVARQNESIGGNVFWYACFTGHANNAKNATIGNRTRRVKL